MRNAIKTTVSTAGVIVGLAGMEHGFFEIMQGNVASNGLIIDAIGPAQELWPGASEPAFTIIPDIFTTGILAVIVGIIMVIWALAFVDKKHGPLGLLFLSVLLFIVGGGFPPLFLGIIASILATRINKPLNWWRNHLPVSIRGLLARSWLWLLIAYITVFSFSVIVAIAGWPFTFVWDVNNIQAQLTPILYILGYVGDILLILTIIAALAYDIQKQTNSHNSFSSDLDTVMPE